MPSQQDILPQRSLSENPKIDSLFLPTARPYPLNPLTCGPPPMYWLGASRWCLGPLCMLHSVWICFFLAFTPFLLSPCLFDSIVRANWCLSFVVWRVYGFLSSYFLPFIPSWTGYHLGKSLHLPTEPVLFFSMTMGLLAIEPTMSRHCVCHNYTSPFYFSLPRGLMGWCSYHVSPFFHQSFA